MNYFLAIVGAGPAGYTAAELALKAGKSVVLFEKEAVGGTCLNVGSIPTKTLLYSAKQYASALHADKYGVHVEGASFDFAAMQQRKTRVVRRLAAGIRAKLKGAEFVQGEAAMTSPHTLVCNGVEYEAENILLATGSHNLVPPIPGINDPRVMDSTAALNLTAVPASVAIIGGGVIGMEFATLFHLLGAKVSIYEAAPTILPNIDPDIVAYLRAKYEKEGIEIHTATAVANIADLDAERVLVCVGRRPNRQGFEDYLSLPNVYTAGDVSSKIMLAHVASREAEVAVHQMLGIEDSIDYEAIPSVVYTYPEIACVGAPIGDEVRTIPMTYSGRFMAENEGELGLLKLVLRDGCIAGVHMIGNPCSEFLSTAVLAVQQRLTPADFRRFVFPHPTVSEV